MMTRGSPSNMLLRQIPPPPKCFNLKYSNTSEYKVTTVQSTFENELSSYSGQSKMHSLQGGSISCYHLQLFGKCFAPTCLPRKCFATHFHEREVAASVYHKLDTFSAVGAFRVSLLQRPVNHH